MLLLSIALHIIYQVYILPLDISLIAKVFLSIHNIWQVFHHTFTKKKQYYCLYLLYLREKNTINKYCKYLQYLLLEVFIYWCGTKETWNCMIHQVIVCGKFGQSGVIRCNLVRAVKNWMIFFTVLIMQF